MNKLSISQLLLVRHSLPEIEPQRPPATWHLSLEGRRRCKLLAGQIRRFQPDMIACSHEPKAMETAQILADELSISLFIYEGLHEHERGSMPRLTHEQFQAGIAKMFEYPDELVFGDETAIQALNRFQQALENLAIHFSRENLLVVSHDTVITLWAADRIQASHYEFWKRLEMPSCVVIAREADGIYRCEIEKIHESNSRQAG